MILIIAAVAAVAAIAFVSLVVFGMNRYVRVENGPFEEQEAVNYVRTDEYTELIGLFDNIEKARSAADRYDIEFIRFRNGLAVFHVSNDRNIDEMLENGRKNGWPKLEYNHLRY